MNVRCVDKNFSTTGGNKSVPMKAMKAEFRTIDFHNTLRDLAKDEAVH